jgi:hypothetical protein
MTLERGEHIGANEVQTATIKVKGEVIDLWYSARPSA